MGPMGLKAQGGRNWESFDADPYLKVLVEGKWWRECKKKVWLLWWNISLPTNRNTFRQEGEHPADIVASISPDIDERTLYRKYSCGLLRRRS